MSERLTKTFMADTANNRNRITITDRDAQSLEDLTELFNVAQQDFPGAAIEAANVVPIVLSTRNWGIEFYVSNDFAVPEGYREIHQAEPILAGGIH